MTADTRLARAVPFELLGADMVLRYRTADLVALEQKYGAGWAKEVEDRLRRSDADVVCECVRLGLKGPGGFTIPKGIDYADLPFAPAEAIGPISDALTSAITGVSYAAIQEQRAAALAALTVEERDGGLTAGGPVEGADTTAGA